MELIINLSKKIVITGIGVTSPCGNSVGSLRKSVLSGVSGISNIEVDYLGEVPAGLCEFDTSEHSSKKILKRGTRAGSIGVYCAGEAIKDSGLDLSNIDKNEVGVYVGITEHGSIETQMEIENLQKNPGAESKAWSPYHMPRIVSNAPAGEICLAFSITGPHMTIGGACAAGNLGIIQAYQMLLLGEVEYALAGGVSESARSFVNFASFNAINGLAKHENAARASRPLDKNRNGIVISEGGAVFLLETLESARKRNAPIYAEIIGYGINTDATSFTAPNSERQAECMMKALKKSGISSKEVDLINLHATGTPAGDVVEFNSVSKVFKDNGDISVNGTKGHLGHCMGASGALEIAANILSLEDDLVHPCLNIDELDENCQFPNLVKDEPLKRKVNHFLSNSFGMLGINSSLVFKKIS